MILSNHAEDDQGCGEKNPEIAFMDDIFFHITKGYDFTPRIVCNLYHVDDYYISYKDTIIYTIYIYYICIYYIYVHVSIYDSILNLQGLFQKLPHKKRGS